MREAVQGMRAIGYQRTTDVRRRSSVESSLRPVSTRSWLTIVGVAGMEGRELLASSGDDGALSPASRSGVLSTTGEPDTLSGHSSISAPAASSFDRFQLRCQHGRRHRARTLRSARARASAAAPVG